MLKIAILSQKGGAGKTTLGLNLGVAAELKKASTAIIDLDPQASITQWGDSREIESPVVVSAQAARLPQILDTCKENGADLVIIDTAPHAEHSALEAARIADLVLIPCRPSIVDLRAIGSTIDICRIADTRAYVVLNQTPSRGTLAQDASQAIADLQVDVAPVQIGQRIAYVHAITAGQGVLEYEPRGKASDEIQKLYKFIMKKAGETHVKDKEKQSRSRVA
jgi:chromosome partitioning protein